MEGVVVSLFSPTSHKGATALALFFVLAATGAAQPLASAIPIPDLGGSGVGSSSGGVFGLPGEGEGTDHLDDLTSPGYLEAAPPQPRPQPVREVFATRTTGEARPERTQVVYPGDAASLRIMAGVVGSQIARQVRFLLGGGQEVVVPVKRVGATGDGWVEARFDPAQLVPEGDVAFVARTTGAGDAPVMQKGLPKVRPDLTVAYHDATMGAPDGSDVSGVDIAEAGGVHRIAFRLEDEQGNSYKRGAVAVAARARWMYLSGHYPAAAGMQLGDDIVHPRTVAGQGWKDQLKVLVWAACYAGEVAGQPPTGAELSGRGLDGADWWDKFGGTLLAYRYIAPTEAAPAVNREFLKRVRRIRVDPSDEARYSTALARAWMAANWRVRATNASAIDSRGNYYYMGTLPAPIPGSRRINRVLKVAPQEAWRRAVDPIRFRTHLEAPLVAALEEVTYESRGSRPFDGVEQFLTAPGVDEYLRQQGFDPADPRVREVLQAKIRYAAHLYYETDAGSMMVADRMAFLASQEGPQVLTRERFRQEMQPSAAAQRTAGGELRIHQYTDQQIDGLLTVAQAALELRTPRVAVQ